MLADLHQCLRRLHTQHPLLHSGVQESWKMAALHIIRGCEGGFAGWAQPMHPSTHLSARQLMAMGTCWATGRDDQVSSLPVMPVTPSEIPGTCLKIIPATMTFTYQEKKAPVLVTHVSCEPNNHHLGSSAVSTWKRSSQLGLLTVSPATPNNLSHAILLELHMPLGWGKSI